MVVAAANRQDLGFGHCRNLVFDPKFLVLDAAVVEEFLQLGAALPDQLLEDALGERVLGDVHELLFLARFRQGLFGLPADISPTCESSSRSYATTISAPAALLHAQEEKGHGRSGLQTPHTFASAIVPVRQ